jgi:phosphate uptake regulator, PhoU
MPREEYHELLDELQAGVESMAQDSLKQLQEALDALDSDDKTLAQAVINDDECINQQYLELEGDCVDLITLQQPVASEMRFVVASFKILTDLERIGDLATNLARYSLANVSETVFDIQIKQTGETVLKQIGEAVTAYVEEDADACRVIAERDDEVDALCQTASDRVVRELVASEPDQWKIEQLLDDVSRLLLTIRDLERVGDHAVNIAARTLYMVESDPELIY